MTRRKYGVRPTARVQREVAAMIAKHGLRGAAKILGIGRVSAASIAIGEQVLGATLIVAEQRLR